MKKLNFVDWLALILVVVGGLNWGLIGFLGFNLVEIVFGITLFSKIIYILVGIAAVYVLIILAKLCRKV